MQSKILKDSTEFVTEDLNYSLEKGVFPFELKIGLVSPIFKKNDNLNKENSRSVSILSHLSNVYERTILRVCIRSYFGLHFPTFGLNTERYSVFIHMRKNAGKCGPEKLWLRTLFTQCYVQTNWQLYKREMLALIHLFPMQPFSILWKH